MFFPLIFFFIIKIDFIEFYEYKSLLYEYIITFFIIIILM